MNDTFALVLIIQCALNAIAIDIYSQQYKSALILKYASSIEIFIIIHALCCDC
jgi:hypothetical protein